MLVNCVAYTKGKKFADIPVADISEQIKKPDTFVWVALKDPTSEELAAIQEEFDLHDLAIEDALKGDQLPKLEEYGSSIFVVMQTIEKQGEELRVGEIAVFVGPKFLVSVRRNCDQGFADVRKRAEKEPDLLQHGPAYVMYALMDAVVDRYIPIFDGLRVEFEALEERIFQGSTTRKQVEALYCLKQKLAILDHAVVPLIDVAGKLHGGRVPPVCAGLADYFRDVSDHLLREEQSIDNLRDMLATAISVNLSLITLQESEVTKRLAAYAALIAVPTLIVGIYGMNFEYLPELHWKYGYPAVLAGMILIDLYLVKRFKDAHWL